MQPAGNPAHSPRFPVHCGILESPASVTLNRNRTPLAIARPERSGKLTCVRKSQGQHGLPTRLYQYSVNSPIGYGVDHLSPSIPDLKFHSYTAVKLVRRAGQARIVGTYSHLNLVEDTLVVLAILDQGLCRLLDRHMCLSAPQRSQHPLLLAV